jgi:hypothetical protein
MLRGGRKAAPFALVGEIGGWFLLAQYEILDE